MAVDEATARRKAPRSPRLPATVLARDRGHPQGKIGVQLLASFDANRGELSEVEFAS